VHSPDVLVFLFGLDTILAKLFDPPWKTEWEKLL